MKLKEALNSIKELDNSSILEAKKRLDNLTKPLGSLGKLEEIVQRLAGIFGTPTPRVDKKTVVIMCADNGVVEENVSSCPKEVTATVTRNFTRGITGINVFTKMANSDIHVVDVGVDEDLTDNKQIYHKKVRKNGTANMLKGPAMSREEAVQAIETGIDMMRIIKEQGYNLVGTGEMGIGNTTTSSAIASVLIGLDPEIVVGKGAGLTSEAHRNKIDVVINSIKINNPDKNDPIDVISKVGGLDIAGLVGCFIGASVYGLPILIDGFISSVAALVAIKIDERVKNFIFSSHSSAEPGGKKVLEAIGYEPMLMMDMRLGEGTGAALAFNLFDAAIISYTQMGTFQEATIDQYQPLE